MSPGVPAAGMDGFATFTSDGAAWADALGRLAKLKAMAENRVNRLKIFSVRNFFFLVMLSRRAVHRQLRRSNVTGRHLMWPEPETPAMRKLFLFTRFPLQT